MTGDARRLLVEKLRAREQYLCRKADVSSATRADSLSAEASGIAWACDELEAALSPEAAPPNHCPACGEPHDGADCPYQYLGTPPAEAVPSAPAGLKECEACDQGMRLAPDGIHYDDASGGWTWGVCRKEVARLRSVPRAEDTP